MSIPGVPEREEQESGGLNMNLFEEITAQTYQNVMNDKS